MYPWNQVRNDRLRSCSSQTLCRAVQQRYPGKEARYTEFKILIEDLKSDNPPVITTQNKEFIEYLLESDLDFNVTTAYLDEDDKKLAHRDVTKETAKEMVYNMGLELR